MGPRRSKKEAKREQHGAKMRQKRLTWRQKVAIRAAYEAKRGIRGELGGKRLTAGGAARQPGGVRGGCGTHLLTKTDYNRLSDIDRLEPGF